jgi:hypothetical protein
MTAITAAALDNAERSQRIHHHDAHEGHADFNCILCHALLSTVIACKEAYRATDTAIIARETYRNA